jgi:NAD-dependent dihydropyrimidine dehydrogenase PreA subunit/flavodoxin
LDLRKGGNILNKRVNLLYFSATGTTKKVVSEIGYRIVKKGEYMTLNEIDFTLPDKREEGIAFNEDDIVIAGVPVYAGRVPNVLLKYLNTIKGNGALAAAVVVYGNRNYDDALIELRDILKSNGFIVVAAAAFIGEHAFSYTLAKGRPDERDMEIAKIFADKLYEKIVDKDKVEAIEVKGNIPYRKYYMPKDENGNPQDIRKVKPKTADSCIDCKLCVKICPMGSIDYDNVSILNGICIKCNACVKRCPKQAKYFDDSMYLRHKRELEIEFESRRGPELFI